MNITQYRKLVNQGKFRGNSKRSESGRREDLGMYFRSKWEANYARYLNFLVQQGNIHKWEYEVDEFWFEGIKRGTRSYKPDFKVWVTADKYEYHEVKGYMDQKSRTKLKRMARYYPNEKIIIIGPQQIMEIRKWARIIPGWE